jgi:CYTH domain-containing protein
LCTTSDGQRDIEARVAAALGFPKRKYLAVERERRWLCREVPRDRIVRTEAITDLYVAGTRLRLREARPLDGSIPLLRLSRKADVDSHTRLITSIYLPEQEFILLSHCLMGKRLRKLRHLLQPAGGNPLCVDEFLDDLKGLLIAEAEFETLEALERFATPEFAIREVTADPKFTGAHLATNGLPKDYDSST